jgi:hypothetical protein
VRIEFSSATVRPGSLIDEESIRVETLASGLLRQEDGRYRRKVAKCRSMLQLANRVLPPDVREDALDEWTDEIECAAAEKKPVFRRALSILCRSLPREAVRSRRPARVRGNGG